MAFYFKLMIKFSWQRRQIETRYKHTIFYYNSNNR